ncbi:hypothetical protein H310_04370 [Aphanomyces invadans]|uniref:WRKY19-like zinc finger domain-containing protein n=1 Tax=Aphanomyces invadans TaxID=157072 RepID=A0A024UED1_9STRA|nr:hypothetical protein H310_04370 [Aphanomyces invadans]ETW03963.1 hypothetical protein H310_04370 [Aphanomyces invadans]|eukprot:XP_008866919.1 hypothetical protein H310_04370 [Aphanomyces invadans]
MVLGSVDVVAKSSVEYILNPPCVVPCHWEAPSFVGPGKRSAAASIQSLLNDDWSPRATHTLTSTTHRNKCNVDGCATAAVSKGRCVRHGGGTRCSVAGCTKRTKRFNRCYLHGGFVLCCIEGCTSKAKRYGRCWAHGGGVQCTEVECTKLAAKGGLCWSHGGGHRCRASGCERRAYKRQHFYCDEHADL